MDSKDKLVTLEDLKVVHDEVARYKNFIVTTTK